MKKVLIILTILLIFPLISAIQVDIDSELNQGETLIAKISGNFLKPILKDNIYFYRDIYTAVPFELELLKIEQDYFIHTSTLGKIPSNYSIVIKESEYYIAGGQTSSEDIVINFSILEDYADFSVMPGVIVAQGSFSLEIQNLKDTLLTIYIDKNGSQEQEQEGFFSFFSGDETPTGQAFTLKAGEIKQVTLEFENVSSETLRIVRLSTEDFSTEIFVYVLFAEEKPEIKRIKFETGFFNISMATNSNATRILYLVNEGTTDFDNVTLIIPDSLKEYISIEPEFFLDLEQNETKRINLNISSKSEAEIIQGTIKAKTSDGFYAYFDIYINFIEAFVPEGNVTDELPIITKTCEELEGEICEKSQECSADQITARDDICCLGECVEKKKSKAGLIIGWTIIIILVALYGWFYLKKYKKTKKKVDLLKVAEGKK